MGGCNSKKAGKRLRYIHPNSPLGQLLVKWDSIEATEGLDKVKMIHYCMEVWPELEVQGRWPWCGTKDKWMCQQLNNYLTAPGDTDPEQLLYVSWDDRTSKRWDPLDYLPPSAPPPYNPLLQAPQMAGPVLPPAAIPLPPVQTPPSTSSASAMINAVSPPVTTPSQPPPAPPVPSAPPQVPTPPAAFSTPSPAPLNIHSGSSPSPIAVPLPSPSWDTNASSPDKQLLSNTPADGQKVQGNPDIPQSSLASEDGPYLGIANQVDQFLGPNIYTWGEMNSILSILFSPEEVQMIRVAGIRIWEKDNRPGPQVPSGEQKLPLTDPSWNPNQEEGRKAMMEYRSLIIQGIKESVPKGTNTQLAFEGTQEKDEAPAAWLNHLKRNFQLYSRIDPDTLEGQMLLKVQFATKSWPDIWRKLEKMEDWQEKDINELLREALKVYLRRDEDKAKAKAKIVVAVARESAGWAGPPPGGGKDRPLVLSGARGMETPQVPLRERHCYYCGEPGHNRRFCRKLSLDAAIAREQDNLEKILRGDD
uniref:CCHC-type domain-containing protein n=1 Tax=Junco hyemalis TaxID=40217 RepID=A0A8C5IBX5_JUNHY